MATPRPAFPRAANSILLFGPFSLDCRARPCSAGPGLNNNPWAAGEKV